MLSSVSFPLSQLVDGHATSSAATYTALASGFPPALAQRAEQVGCKNAM